MSTATYGGADAAVFPVSTRRFSWDGLVGLVTAANAIIESDVNAAKACLERATELLQSDSRSNVAKSASARGARGGLAPWQAKRIVSYIEANLASSIRAEDLAEVTQLSTSHFFRAFRESFGEAPLAYVSQRRMRRAQKLMLTSHESLAQIALACGMCDQAHFTHVFRRVVGINPRQWRRQFAPGPAKLPRPPG